MDNAKLYRYPSNIQTETTASRSSRYVSASVSLTNPSTPNHVGSVKNSSPSPLTLRGFLALPYNWMEYHYC